MTTDSATGDGLFAGPSGMENSMPDSVCSSRLASQPATVSSSSSLEDVDSLNLLPPIADPLSVLPTSKSHVSTTPTSVSPALTPTPRTYPDTSGVALVTNPLATPVSCTPVSTVVTHPSHVPIMPSLPTSASQAVSSGPVANNNTVAEFLYQLTKMLSDDNSEVIEWSNGKIEVHNPHKLASHVLNRYFRHSKFASFQRQLNYFGFRKLAGKGKMAPCSYVNDATTLDLRSLLLIKRKTSVTPSKDKKGRKRERPESQAHTTSGGNKSSSMSTTTVNPVLAGILHQNISSPQTERTNSDSSSTAPIAVGKGVKHQLNGYLRGTPSNSHVQLARAAAGKGIRHGFSFDTAAVRPMPKGGATAALKTRQLSFPDLLNGDLQNSLNELTNNYRNSLCGATATKVGAESSVTPEEAGAPLALGMLSRDSSLIDLAMLPPVSSVDPTPVSELATSPMTFVDFPLQDLDPNGERETS